MLKAVCFVGVLIFLEVFERFDSGFILCVLTSKKVT